MPASLLESSCSRSHKHHHHHHHHHHRNPSPSSVGRSSPASVVDGEQAKSRMRWILSLGLLLPALAAIIGVVAWAVSAEVVMGARRDSAFKLSGPSSRYHHQNGRNSDDIERLDLKVPNREVTSSTNRSSRTSNRKGITKESRNDDDSVADSSSSKLASSKHEERDNRNANVYFLSGLDDLNSEIGPTFSSLTAGEGKKSAGARVAEVIDRLVSQRKKEGTAPHIVVVAPVPDSKRRTSTPAPSTTTDSSLSTPASSPSSSKSKKSDSFESASFTRDSDSLLAAAHFLARHHFASRRSDLNNDRVSLEPENEGKPAFESASLLASQSDSDYSASRAQGGLSKPVGPQFRQQQQHDLNNNRPIIGGIPSTMNAMSNQALNNMEESNLNQMASSASEHHMNYLPPNRMGQAGNQMIPQINPNQLQYRVGHHSPPPPPQPQGPPVYGPGPVISVANMGRVNGAPVSPSNQQILIDNGGQLIHPNHGVLHQMSHHPDMHQFTQYQQQQQQQQLQQQAQQDYHHRHHFQQEAQAPYPPVGASSNYAPIFEPNNNNQPNQRPNQQAINRDSYVAQESNSAPLIDFSAQTLPDNEDEGYAESAPAKGLTFHFGGGPMGGGGQVMTSPLGIFKTLLLPLLPKPRMNLNGKVVFGVVLEKGVGFGKQKHLPPPPPPPYHGHHFGKRK